MPNQPFNIHERIRIDERIRSLLTDILESHGIGEPDCYVPLDGPDVAATKQLIRDGLDYVESSYITGTIYTGDILTRNQVRARRKELGL